MPTFSPTIALLATYVSFSLRPSDFPGRMPTIRPGDPSGALDWFGARSRSSRLSRTSVVVGSTGVPLFSPIWAARDVTPSATPPARRLAGKRGARPSGRLDLYLDVHAGREVEPLERVDRLGRVLDDVDQALVHPHLEVVAGVLVLVGRPDHRVAVLVGRQRDRPEHLGLRPEHRLHDLLRRLVQDLVVVGLQPDANFLLGAVGHGACSRSVLLGVLLEDLRDPTGSNGATTLTDGETQTFSHCNGLAQLHGHLRVVTGHDHLGALGQ